MGLHVNRGIMALMCGEREASCGSGTQQATASHIKSPQRIVCVCRSSSPCRSCACLLSWRQLATATALPRPMAAQHRRQRQTRQPQWRATRAAAAALRWGQRPWSSRCACVVASAPGWVADDAMRSLSDYSCTAHSKHCCATIASLHGRHDMYSKPRDAYLSLHGGASNA